MKTSYSPWGVRSILQNTTGFNIPRGYTMHEHLDEFGLINMNARLYDPYIARFLSPDPYIQDPENSQNFNRYSYCLNNPLKYTDPSGEFWLELGIGMTISAIVNGFSTKNSGGKFWDGAWKGAIVGGVSSAAGIGVSALTSKFEIIGALSGLFIKGGIQGGAEGLVSGFSNALMNNDMGCFGKGFLQGALTGFISGGIQGGIDGYNNAKMLLQQDGFSGSAFTGRIAHNMNTIQLSMKDIGALQIDESKHCYAYVLEYADNGYGNKRASFFIQLANEVDGYDAIKLACDEKSKMYGNYFMNDFANWESSLEACPNQSTILSITSSSGTNHWVVVTKATFADKVKILGGHNSKRILWSADIWDPIRGHIKNYRNGLSYMGLVIPK